MGAGCLNSVQSRHVLTCHWLKMILSISVCRTVYRITCEKSFLVFCSYDFSHISSAEVWFWKPSIRNIPIFLKYMKQYLFITNASSGRRCEKVQILPAYPVFLLRQRKFQGHLCMLPGGACSRLWWDIFSICKQRNWYFHIIYSWVGFLIVVSQMAKEWLKSVPKVCTKIYLYSLPMICIFF